MPSSKCPVKIVTVHRGHVKQRITPPSAYQALLGYWSAPLICVRRCSNVAAVLGAYVGSAKLSCIYLLRTICSRTILLAQKRARSLYISRLEYCPLANMVRAHNDYTASKQLRNQPPKGARSNKSHQFNLSPIIEPLVTPRDMQHHSHSRPLSMLDQTSYQQSCQQAKR